MDQNLRNKSGKLKETKQINRLPQLFCDSCVTHVTLVWPWCQCSGVNPGSRRGPPARPPAQIWTPEAQETQGVSAPLRGRSKSIRRQETGWSQGHASEWVSPKLGAAWPLRDLKINHPERFFIPVFPPERRQLSIHTLLFP